jgi:hypothetical protein
VADRRDQLAMTALEGYLRDLGGAIAYPPVSDGFASAIQARLEREPRGGGSWWQRLRNWLAGSERPARRPFRRALVLAVILLLVLAAIATAIGLGLPGIRIVFGPGPSSPPPPASTATPPTASGSASGALGRTMGLGVETPFDGIEARTGFAPRLPAGLGQPAASYVRDRRLIMVWPPSPENPEIAGTGVGLLVTEFEGDVDSGYYEKAIHSGTTVEPVTVDGVPGFWISGEPHPLFYVDANGNNIDEARRIVGQVLIWADADLTYRLETSLPRDKAIALAESIH